eukprot:CAMPEP_0184488024 /NCGR_PEP_ID=MMETSP0113_2-20130426/10481_1 /TAXON_ID=91329 /ORGANISM="Norrisiella sphaerica, Strain BC52" /LENGTH=607 /DNA_ID=CAMNT_0026870487 /DNA_START=528 /DNA_END=2351 /DNA_ORIENTATION=-
MITKHYDLIIIGGGPTGCAAAEKAAYAGHTAMVIDDPGSGAKLQLGGPTGLFSKALRDTASRIDVKLLKAMGMSDKSIWSQVQDMCKEIALVETQNTVRRLRSIAVPRIQGRASFVDTSSVELELRNGKRVPVSADYYLLATGSSAFRDPNIPFDGRRVFDSDSIKDLAYLPNSVAITGAGIIAIEYAKIFAKLGAHVSLVIRDSSFPAAMERVGVDRDIAEELRKDLEETGVELKFSTVVGKFSVPPSISNPMSIELQNRQTGKATGETLEVDTYLFAAGRLPNIGGLGLENAGIQVDERGRVLVDTNLETSAKGVYAAGDVLGPPGLASTGIEQGAAAVGAMFNDDPDRGKSRSGGFDPKSYLSDPDRFPVGIWTNPEVAYIGLTKAKAEERGFEVAEGNAKYSETTRGRVSRSRGMLKLVVDAGKRDLPVIGVSIFGNDACELVHYGMELVQSRRPLRKVLEASHAAVTYHELYKAAAVHIDEQLEFSVQLRSTFDLPILRSAKEKFQEVLAARASLTKGNRIAGSRKGSTEEEAVRIPLSEAEDIAKELGLLDWDDEISKTAPEEGDLSYTEYLEYLRQLAVKSNFSSGPSENVREYEYSKVT